MWFDSVCTKLTPVESDLCISWFFVTTMHQLVQCYNCVSVGSVTTLHQLVLCNNCLLIMCFMYKQYISGGPRQFQCNPSLFGNPGLSTHTIGAISICRSIEGTSFRPLVWCDNCQNISDSSEAAPPISQRWLKHGWHQPEVIKTWLGKHSTPNTMVV